MKSVLFMLLTSFFSHMVATQIANDTEAQLRTNRDTYIFGPHTVERQQAALAYFDSTWQQFHSSNGCGSTLLGSAGHACIADRMRTGQWPWESYYRDPIAIATPGS
jgi:hypothetical protein